MIQAVHALAHDQLGGLVVFHEVCARADSGSADLIVREAAGRDHKGINVQHDVILMTVNQAHGADVAGLLRIHLIEAAHLLEHRIKAGKIHAAADFIAGPCFLVHKQHVHACFGQIERSRTSSGACANDKNGTRPV